jgi:DNA invertase Pin-like site-specific DNA recombinase
MIAYTRVSTSEQGESGAGLQAQRSAILQAHPSILEWHEDVASGSGKKPLPGRDAAIAACIRTKQPLVCAKLDRLTRSAIDFYELNEQARKHGFALILLDIQLDTRSPMGEAMAGMVAVFAQLERRRISERTREAMQALKTSGSWTAKRSGRVVHGFGRAPVPQEAVRRVTDLLQTARPAEVYRIVRAEGLPIGRSSVYALAKR